MYWSVSFNVNNDIVCFASFSTSIILRWRKNKIDARLCWNTTSRRDTQKWQFNVLNSVWIIVSIRVEGCSSSGAQFENRWSTHAVCRTGRAGHVVPRVGYMISRVSSRIHARTVHRAHILLLLLYFIRRIMMIIVIISYILVYYTIGRQWNIIVEKKKMPLRRNN